MAKSRICSIDGCGKPMRTRGMCAIHYNRMRRTGDPGTVIIRRGAPMQWLLAHVNYSGGECLLWPFQRNNSGYATISQMGKKRSAARIMCNMAYGSPRSASDDTAHSCGKGHLGCINPRHLSWKTRAGNMQDAIDHGTSAKGTKNPQSSLNEDDVRAIRALKGRLMYKEIAPIFGITPSAVGLIMRGERWGWLS